MQSQLNDIRRDISRYLRPRLSKYPKLHYCLVSLHRTYCFLTGFMHVLPDYYIIGAAKSGTTSLYDYLVQHQCVQPITTKEPRFFDKYYNRGENWYRINFPFTFQKFISEKINKNKFITGDATPRYLDHPHAPHRIKKITPNAKFIVLLRNPIDRAYSNYNMRINAKREHLSFEDTIEKERKQVKDEFKKMQQNEEYYSRDYYHNAYLDRSIYVDKLKRWMEVFPKEKFLIIQSEEFFKDTSKMYKEVLEFLNLPNQELPEYKQIGKAKYKQPKMNSETRKKLVEYFKPHNERLYEFLGRRFDWDE
jgi:hypothetical protein